MRACPPKASKVPVMWGHGAEGLATSNLPVIPGVEWRPQAGLVRTAAVAADEALNDPALYAATAVEGAGALGKTAELLSAPNASCSSLATVAIAGMIICSK